MPDLNLCQFIGRLGRDPEARTLPNGDSVVNFSIACDNSYKDKNGQKVEQTDWVNVVAFRQLADIMAKYLKKGAQVYIAGRLKTRNYQDKQSGADRYVTEIVADQMQMLGGKSDGGGGGQQQSAPQQQRPANHPSQTANAAPDYDDDIPF